MLPILRHLHPLSSQQQRQLEAAVRFIQAMDSPLLNYKSDTKRLIAALTRYCFDSPKLAGRIEPSLVSLGGEVYNWASGWRSYKQSLKPYSELILERFLVGYLDATSSV